MHLLQKCKEREQRMPVKRRERSKIVILDIQDIKEKIQLNLIKTRFLSVGEYVRSFMKLSKMNITIL